MRRRPFLLGGLSVLAAMPARAQADTARYRFEVTLNWAPEGADAPANPHWSRLIAFSHSSRYRLFADGDTASSGLALVATNGRTRVLEAELAEGRRRDRVGDVVVTEGLNSGSGQLRFDMTLTPKHRFVSCATMLAPSPDWFTGISGFALRIDDVWQAQRRAPLWPWDAGADSGEAYSGPDAPTQPRQSVRLLAHPAFLRPEGLVPIGEIRARRLV